MKKNLHYYKIVDKETKTTKILGNLRYWRNKNSLEEKLKYPNYSFNKFLDDNNLAWQELTMGNANININGEIATITFANALDIFDYFIVRDENKNISWYFYCEMPSNILNMSGAITLNFVMDKWYTYMYDMNETLRLENVNSYFIRKHDNRVLKNASIHKKKNELWYECAVLNPKSNTNKLTFTFNSNKDIEFTYDLKLELKNDYSIEYLLGSDIKIIKSDDANVCGGIVDNIPPYAQKSQITYNNKLYVYSGNWSQCNRVHWKEFTLNKIESKMYDLLKYSGVISNVRKKEFVNSESGEKITFNVENSIMTKSNIQFSAPYDISVEFSGVISSYKINDRIDKTNVNNIELVGMIKQELEPKFNEIILYTNKAPKEKQNTYYIDENIQSYLKFKENDAQTYISEAKKYNNEKLCKNMLDTFSLLNDNNYHFVDKKFDIVDSHWASQKIKIGELESKVLVNKDSIDINFNIPNIVDSYNKDKQFDTNAGKYLDSIFNHKNNYWYVVIKCDGQLNLDNAPTFKKSCNGFFLLPLANNYHFEIKNSILGTGNTWENLMRGDSSIINKDNIVGFFSTTISPILMGYSNKNSLEDLYPFHSSSANPWAELDKSTKLWCGFYHYLAKENDGQKILAPLVIYTNNLPNDIELVEKPKFITKLNKLLDNFNNLSSPPLVIKENEPMLLSSAYANISYLSSRNNEISLSLPYIDTTYNVKNIYLNTFILQNQYIRFNIKHWNSKMALSANADEITIMENKMLPIQTTALSDYLAQSATTWDTQRNNATNQLIGDEIITGITGILSIIAGIVVGIVSMGAGAPVSAKMIAGGAGIAVAGLGGKMAKSGIQYNKSMNSINSEIQNKIKAPNNANLPTFAGGLSCNSEWNENINGFNILTKELTPFSEDIVYSKATLYGYRVEKWLKFTTFNNRQDFNYFEIDISKNINDLETAIKNRDKLKYDSWINEYLNYIHSGIYLMNKPIDDLLNDTNNYEWEFVK